MIAVSLTKIAAYLKGKLHGNDASINHVSTHSDAIQEATLFVALVGKNHDAHTFLEAVVSNGVKAVLVDRKVDVPQHVSQIIVGDTTQSLGKLGQYVKEQVRPFSLALTGSCGKTTVKEMLSEIMATQGKVHTTSGNFNNEIGVPLTLLGLTEGDQFGVFELGANHIGEIDYTSGFISPDIALVNNIGAAHLEGFGSLDGVAQAKSEIYKHVPHDGCAVVNLDGGYADFLQEKSKHCRQIFFSATKTADICATQLKSDAHGCYKFMLHTPTDTAPVSLKLAGRHQVDNALAAASMAYAAQVPLADIVHGLTQVQPVDGRMRVYQFSDITMVDDTYNANPSSVKAAIDWLSQSSGDKWLVLGDLGELGPDEQKLHQEIGVYAHDKGLDRVLTLGTLSQHVSQNFPNGEHYDEMSSLIQDLSSQLSDGKKISLLIKGSRSAKMERLVQALEKRLHRGEHKAC